MTDESNRRDIKSYVLRQGRMTAGQSRALEHGWPRYGLTSADGLLDLTGTFQRSAETVLEIGFGMGESLAGQAAMSPEKDFIGVEVHRPGVGHLLMLALESSLSNLRVYAEDSIDVLTVAVAEDSLDAVQVFFPDPWPKKRHHKRRLLNHKFLNLVVSRLKPGGVLHIATDWVPYAEEVEILFQERSEFKAITAPSRPETKFERRGQRLGHEVRDLAYCLDK